LLRAGAACAAALALLCAAAGCGQKTGAGATISYPLATAPRRLDPVVAEGAAAFLVLENCMEGLVRLDAQGNPTPGAAERWEASADGKTITFYLRKDARWRLPPNAREVLGAALYDAEYKERVKAGDFAYGPVTAADFVFGLRRAVDPGSHAPGADVLFGIRNAQAIAGGKQKPETLGVRAADDFTLVLTLETTGAEGRIFDLATLAQSVAMPCNEAYFNACKGRYGLAPEYLPCNGPFFLFSQEDLVVRLRKNTVYAGAQPVLPAAVHLRVQPDPAQRLRLLGESDGYSAAPVAEEVLRAAGYAANENDILLQNSTLCLVSNCGRAPLQNTKLRQALYAALDTAALGLPTVEGVLPPCAQIGSVPLRALAGEPQKIAHDPARAAQLLQAGGDALQLDLLCTPENEKLLQRMLQQWQQVFGLAIKARVEPLEPAALAARLQSGDYDVAITSLRAESSFAPQALEGMSGGMAARYQSKVFAALLGAAKAQTGTPEQAARACLLAEEHLLQNGVVYPLAPQTERLLLAKGVEGLVVSPAGERVFFAGAKVFL
jgi:ABC-type oligopeptide transport system substrate-binding subunit